MSDELEKRVSRLERLLETATEAWKEMEAAVIRASDDRERRLVLVLTSLSHTAIALALIIAYVIVSVTGGDGNLVLGILGGYLGGAAVTKTTQKGNN